MAITDEVRLTVPATPEFLRLARVTAAGLASRLGFSYDEVEDLRLAIDELCFGLTGTDGRDGTVGVRYILGDDTLVIEGEARFSGHPGAGPPHTDAGERAGLSELSSVILDALVDEHRFDRGAQGPRFRLVKRRQAAAAPDHG